MNKYLATVHLNGQSIKTIVFAISSTHARLLVQYQFGMSSITSTPIKVEGNLIGYKPLDEVMSAIAPLTPQQQRIRSLQAQRERISMQLKSERDKQKIDKAQQQIQSVRFRKIAS